MVGIFCDILRISLRNYWRLLDIFITQESKPYEAWSSKISQKLVVICYWFQKFYFISYVYINTSIIKPGKYSNIVGFTVPGFTFYRHNYYVRSLNTMRIWHWKSHWKFQLHWNTFKTTLKRFTKDNHTEICQRLCNVKFL